MKTDFYNKAKSFDRDEKSIRNIMQLYTIKGLDYDLNNMYISTVHDLYKNTISVLDEKIKEGITLNDIEKNVYNTCYTEINSKNKLKGIIRIISWGVIGNLINAYETIYHLLPTGQIDAKAQKMLQDKGNELLPNYSSYLTSFIKVLDSMFTLDSAQFLAQIKALDILTKPYRKYNADNKNEAHIMLQFANNSYGGLDMNFNGYTPLKKESYPTELQPLYDEEKGIYNGGHGLKVWTAENKDTVVISYSGTDIKNFYMDYEDFNQIFSGSVLYLEAAGFLNIFTNKFKDKKFMICGHSLGGGLAQFSTVANVNNFNKEYKCYAYNPAGLSTESINHLGETRILNTVNNIFVYVTTKDFVSLSGAKLGTIITLPKTSKNGHRIAALNECMEKYLLQTNNKILKNNTFTKVDIYSCAPNKDTLFKSVVSSSADGKLVYPIFNNNIENKQSKIYTISIDNVVFNNLINTDKKDNFKQCLGVYNKFNGDAYTVVNRLCILDEENITNIPFNKEYALSILLFGTYGAGKKVWLEKLLDIISDEKSSISKSNLDKYLFKLKSEYDYMLQAFIYIMKEKYNVELQSFIEKDINKKNKALEIIYKYSIQNKTIYFKYNYNRELIKEERIEYSEEKLKLFNELISELLMFLVEEKILTADKKENILINITSYAKQYFEKP